MNILGISCYYHDAAACLVQDGRIIAAASEERFTRKKHDPSFPLHAIGYCLKEGGVSGRDLGLVAFYDKPFIKFERLLETYLAYAPRGLRSFIKAVPLWIKQKLWIRETIREELGFDGRILFPEHHQSHAASAFFPSPFEQAAFLTLDGVGEWATASYGIGRDNEINILAELHFPHSLGLLYSAFTYYLGFRVNSGEYKVMGLAPYGEPRFRDLILSELMDLKEDGSFRLNMKYFDYCAGLRMITRRFEELFGGPARRPDSEITQRHMDIACSIQNVTVEIILRMVRHLHRQTGQKNLCLAGGVALNCVANGRVLREGPFDQVWIQPAAGDAGGALGAALLAWYQYLGNRRIATGQNDLQRGSLLGPGFDNVYIKDLLMKNNIDHVELNDDELAEKATDLIAEQKVVGWFQGRMEFGPRALGNRSILGDARSPIMQKKMNQKIKFRESFRPFAPAVLAERAGEYFEIDRESPYMLLVNKVRGTDLPAVTHVDRSARVQTVRGSGNPLFYRVIERFGEKYGHPVVINTSFNVREEPIVCSPEDALQCFLKTGMECLIMGNFLVQKDRIQ